jgi:hypothetical protein
MCDRAKATNRLQGLRTDLKRLKIANERKSLAGTWQQLQAMQEQVQKEKQSWKDEIGRLREELDRERAERKLADVTHSLALELAIGDKVNSNIFRYFIPDSIHPEQDLVEPASVSRSGLNHASHERRSRTVLISCNPYNSK